MCEVSYFAVIRILIMFPIGRTTTSRYNTRPTTPTTARTTPTPTTRGTTSRTTSRSTSTARPDYDEIDCQPSLTTVRGKSVCRNEIIFEEHFTGTTLSKLWKNAVQMPLDTEDAEFVSYQNLPSICSVKDGYFNIFPKLLSEIPGFSDDSVRTGTLDFGAR